MTRSVESAWLSSFLDAAAATGRVLGIAMGGSYGRGTADEFSDIDLFFLIDPDELTALFRKPPSFLTDLLPGRVTETYASLVPEFGLKYTVLGSTIGLCDLFFEDAGGFPTPLREGTEMVWDPDGRFSALNDALLAECRNPRTRNAHTTRMAVQLVSEYAGATKSVARGRAVQARYRISKIVNLLLGVHGSADDHWWYGHCVADDALRDPSALLAAGVHEAVAEMSLTKAHWMLGRLCIEAITVVEGLAAETREAMIAQLKTSAGHAEGR
ncbi:nucleotidyltransferase domain-containing protein [Actinomadura graeca]|uniref:Nucleotidyltransferase domain-containing protein n=1 Tax=Actinomadura graeca TaxID=2750812 RepID=A0ABX8QRE8_9ACTN|nr:nucleotidyltransferase domain-containing protein [Actinomadura graeca]QXJ21302.1 nucleotidyltransferase domain-containing protein [Actinomadura graeca]